MKDSSKDHEMIHSGKSIDLSNPDNTQVDRGRSAFAVGLWYFLGAPLLETRLIPFRGFKAFVLRLFGASVGRRTYIKPGVKVKFPWYLAIGDHSWVGEDVWIDNLSEVTIGANACVSQGAYLCTGNHDWSTRNMKLFRRPIELCDGSWVGARAVVTPGVTIGTGAVVNAGSVVTKSVPAWQIWGGNPAKYVRERRICQRAEDTASG